MSEAINVSAEFTMAGEHFARGVQGIIQNVTDFIAAMLDNTEPHDYHMKRWLDTLPTLGWMDDKYAYLIIVNKEHPALSYIIKEAL